MNKKALPSIEWRCSESGSRIPQSVLNRFKPLNVNVQASGKPTFNLFGEIDEYADYWLIGTSLRMVNEFLDEAGGRDVLININSPGGSLMEGIAIYNLLRTYSGGVEMHVLGMAASAASVVAMAADELKIAPSAFLMIHNCWLFAGGNRLAFERLVEDMRVFDETMVKLYQERTGLDKSEIVKMMDRETFISGEKAVELGFAGEILEEVKPVARKDSDGQILEALKAARNRLAIAI